MERNIFKEEIFLIVEILVDVAWYVIVIYS